MYYMQAIADFRDRCSLCFVYDWITIPLVYTQVNKVACSLVLMASPRSFVVLQSIVHV